MTAENADYVRKLLQGRGHLLFDAEAPRPRKPLGQDAAFFNVLAVPAANP